MAIRIEPQRGGVCKIICEGDELGILHGFAGRYRFIFRGADLYINILDIPDFVATMRDMGFEVIDNRGLPPRGPRSPARRRGWDEVGGPAPDEPPAQRARVGDPPVPGVGEPPLPPPVGAPFAPPFAPPGAAPLPPPGAGAGEPPLGPPGGAPVIPAAAGPRRIVRVRRRDAPGGAPAGAQRIYFYSLVHDTNCAPHVGQGDDEQLMLSLLLCKRDMRGNGGAQINDFVVGIRGGQADSLKDKDDHVIHNPDEFSGTQISEATYRRNLADRGFPLVFIGQITDRILAREYAWRCLQNWPHRIPRFVLGGRARDNLEITGDAANFTVTVQNDVHSEYWVVTLPCLHVDEYNPLPGPLNILEDVAGNALIMSRFRYWGGDIAQPPAGTPAHPGWPYVRGEPQQTRGLFRNHLLWQITAPVLQGLPHRISCQIRLSQIAREVKVSQGHRVGAGGVYAEAIRLCEQILNAQLRHRGHAYHGKPINNNRLLLTPFANDQYRELAHGARVYSVHLPLGGGGRVIPGGGDPEAALKTRVIQAFCNRCREFGPNGIALLTRLGLQNFGLPPG